MPENLVTEVFGKNARYADSTNTTVTPNPDNAEFSYNVTFDSSKIPEKPKRNTNSLVRIGMPSDKFIDINIAINNRDVFYCPEDGYISASIFSRTGGAIAVVVSDSNNFDESNFAWKDYKWAGVTATPQYSSLAVLVPVKKNQYVYIHLQGETSHYCKFIYAEGTI